MSDESTESNMASTYTIEIDQGATYAQQFKILDVTGAPLDLTAYDLTSQLRIAYTDPTASGAFTIQACSPSSSGCMQMSLTPSQSMVLAAAEYVYDVEMSQSGSVFRLFQGRAFVSPNTTR